MLDPGVVLYGQTIAYTLYVLAVMSIMAWFAYRVTRGPEVAPVKSGFFYTYVVVLIVVGVSLHLATGATIPWKERDLNMARIEPDRTFEIEAADHRFKLPTDTLSIKTGEVVRFDVTSNDLTYGFGLFRPDNTMLFQMQVIPGHVNSILWEFDQPGTYTIRSTEYSGPDGIAMMNDDAVVVTE